MVGAQAALDNLNNQVELQYATIAQAEAAHVSAEAQEVEARQEQERQQSLSQSESGTRQRLEQATAGYAKAQADVRAGQFDAAAAKLDSAIKLSPNSPDLLQDRAELAIRLKDYATAEQLARKSWEIGPRLGPLCARNWQTIEELRDRAGDQGAAATAGKWVKQCHVEGVPRY